MALDTTKLQKYIDAAKALLGAGFCTRAAQKEANEAASRAFDVLTAAVKDVHLNGDASAAAKAVYFAIPMYPHQWRAKHAEMIRADLPGAAKYIEEIEAVVALVASIKAAPIVKKVKVERAPQAGDRIQYRGHCQCCGRIHAVSGGYVAQHGYKVKFNQFIGVCTGHMHNAMEEDRAAADKYAASWRGAAEQAEKRAVALKAGEVFPATAPVSAAHGAEQVNFADAPKSMQQRAVKAEIGRCENQARGLRAHADAMERLVNKVHGKPLQQVVIPGNK